MARREDENTAISLFSFQDIITSITGIMFLVVLLLVLSLLSSHLPTGNAADSAERAKLAAEAARLQAAAEVLKLNALDSEKQLAELRKLSASELIKRSKELQDKLRILQTDEQIFAAELKRLELHINSATEKAEKLIDSGRELTAAIESTTRQLAELQQEKSNLQKLLQQQKQLMKYTIAQSSGKIPLLLEIGADGIQLLNTENMQKNDLRNPDPKKSCDSLQALLSQFDCDQYYFSTAVKPGGFAHAVKVLAILKKAGFERGIEIIPDDESSIFQEEAQ